MWTAILLLAPILLLAACTNMSTTEKRAARGAATGVFRGQAAIGSAAASTAGGYIYDKTVKTEEDGK